MNNPFQTLRNSGLLRVLALLFAACNASCGIIQGQISESMQILTQSGGSPTITFTPQIFRSVGVGSTSALACGQGMCANAGNVTISSAGLSAVFTSSLATNIGVGDAIVYDCSGDGALGAGDCVAFISARGSSTLYGVLNAGGNAPTSYTGSMWKIFRAYTSLSNAVNGTENTGISGINAGLGNFDNWMNGTDLTVLQFPWNIALYADATDTTNVTVAANWVTSATYYLRIYTPYLSSEVGISQRHSGVVGSGYMLRTSTVNSTIDTNVNYLYIDGLILETTYSSGTSAPMITSGGTFNGTGANYYSNNIIYQVGTGTATNWGGFIAVAYNNTDASIPYYIWNNILFGSGSMDAAIQMWEPNPMFIYNNTMYNVYAGVVDEGGSNQVRLINNLAQVCFNNCYATSGTWGTGTDYNVASDNHGTSGSHSSINATASFVSTATHDYRISISDTAAKGKGTSLAADTYFSFTMDLQAIARGAIWDVGASTAH